MAAAETPASCSDGLRLNGLRRLTGCQDLLRVVQRPTVCARPTAASSAGMTRGFLPVPRPDQRHTTPTGDDEGGRRLQRLLTAAGGYARARRRQAPITECCDAGTTRDARTPARTGARDTAATPAATAGFITALLRRLYRLTWTSTATTAACRAASRNGGVPAPATAAMCITGMENTTAACSNRQGRRLRRLRRLRRTSTAGRCHGAGQVTSTTPSSPTQRQRRRHRRRLPARRRGMTDLPSAPAPNSPARAAPSPFFGPLRARSAGRHDGAKHPRHCVVGRPPARATPEAGPLVVGKAWRISSRVFHHEGPCCDGLADGPPGAPGTPRVPLTIVAAVGAEGDGLPQGPPARPPSPATRGK